MTISWARSLAVLAASPKLLEMNCATPEQMALVNTLCWLDFRLIAGRARNAYFAAIQAGMDRNYEPMEKLFAEIIARSLAAT